MSWWIYYISDVRNTGKPSEKDFQTRLRKLGKDVYIHRLADAAEVFGRVGKVGFDRAMPSDFLVVLKGQTEFAEVKSTQQKTSLPFSILKTSQSAAAKMITTAGGLYYVYAHNLNTDVWYKIPFWVIESVKAQGKSSIKWEDLKDYEWTS